MNPSRDVFIQNRTFDEIKVGDSAQLVRVLRTEDIQLFAAISGDINPTHLDPEFAHSGQFRDIVGHSLWGGTLVSAILGNEFPGPGTVYVSQSLNFWRPVTVGDTLTVTITCREMFEHNHHIVFDCKVLNQNGAKVMDGVAEVSAPTERIRRPRVLPPEISIADQEERFRCLLALTEGMPPLPVAAAFPCDAITLRGLLQAAEIGLILPILVGPGRKIRAVAEEQGLGLKGRHIVDVDEAHATRTAIALCRDGEARALAQGSLHLGPFLRAVLSRDSGLRTARRASHAFFVSASAYPKPLLLTDAVLNTAPTLEEKIDIIQSALELSQMLGVCDPKVALLASTDTVDPNIPTTQEIAALCEMASSGRIRGGLLDGPLCFDSAVSPRAAHAKGLHSPVAGNADVLVAPNAEAAHMIAKQFECLIGALTGGLILGTQVPVILAGRADTVQTRTVSCIIAQLLNHHNKEGSFP